VTAGSPLLRIPGSVHFGYGVHADRPANVHFGYEVHVSGLLGQVTVWRVA